MNYLTARSKAVCRFMNSYTAMHIKNLDPQLVTVIVHKMGGTDAFYEQHEAINMNGCDLGVTGFNSAQERIQFFKENKKHLIAYCAEIAKFQGFTSGLFFIYQSMKFDITPEPTLDEVAATLFEPISAGQVENPSALLDKVIEFIVYLVIEEVCEEFEAMLHSETA